MFKFILTISLITNAHLVFSEQLPKSSLKDSRIKFVEYDPHDVVKISVSKGFATQINFAPAEKIKLVRYGVLKNWEQDIHENILYIKPNANTLEYSNILILTDKRSYSLLVKACKDECTKDVTYNLIYTYSQNKTKQEHQIQEQEIAKKILKISKNNYKNYQYTAQGNQEIRPLDAWDDGQFTYLKFQSYKTIPAVYIMKDDKTEALTNNHIENRNTIVIHQLAKTFILRNGKQVLAVHNENYGKQKIVEDSTTTSRFVERVIYEN